MSRHPTFDKSTIDKFRENVSHSPNPITYLAIDPGKYNGVCGYDAKFYLQFMFVVSIDDMIEFLDCFQKVETCVMEDYRLFPNKAQQQIYSKMDTVRVIGRVESWAKLHKTDLVLQPSRIKPTGYAWIGQKPPRKQSNMNDPTDAHVHMMYWAVLTKRIKAEELLKRTTKPSGG